jgi:HTTM domain
MKGPWVKRLDYWIFESYCVRVTDLAVYRIVYSTYVLLTYLPSATWLRHTPHAFFSPPVSLAALFTTFPPSSLLVALNVLLGLFLSMLIFGLHTRVASMGTSIVLVVINSWAYALGKINHDILLVITPAVLAFSGWGNALSLDSLRRPRHSLDPPKGAWSLALLALLIGISMFTAGWTKVATGWLNPTTLSTYGYLLNNYFVTGRHTWLGERALWMDSFWLWKSADWFATILECGFVFAIFSPRSMRIVMAIACLFHLGIWLLFDIVFASNVITYGAFVPYSTLTGLYGLRNIAVHRLGVRRWAFAWMAFIMTLLVALSISQLGEPLQSFVGPPVRRGVVLLGAVIGCGYFLGLAHTIILHPLYRGLRARGKT